MQSPIDKTAIAQKVIDEAVQKGTPELLNDSLWNKYFEELYMPFTEVFALDVVQQQFVHDKYLINKNALQAQIEVLKQQIAGEKNRTFDDSQLKKQKTPLSRAAVLQKGWGDMTSLDAAAFGINALQKCFDILSSGFCTKELINRGDLRTGRTVLHAACTMGNYDLVRLLCKFGADINAQSNGGGNSLYHAICSQQVNISTYLLAQGAKFDVPDNDGYTPLHLAVRVEQIEIVRLLIAQGAKLDIENSKGYTPLHSAVKQEHVEIAKFLFEMGANPYQKTKNGKTAFDLIPAKNANEFQFLNGKVAIDKMNMEALLCFICFSAIRPYPKESIEELSNAFKELKKLNPSVLDNVKSLAIPDAKKAMIERLLQTLNQGAEETKSLSQNKKNDNERIICSNSPQTIVDTFSKLSVSQNIHSHFKAVPSQVMSQPTSADLDAFIAVCQNADLPKVKEYVERRQVNPAIPDRQGRYALGEAIWHLAPNVVSYLLEKQNPSYTQDDLQTILMSIKKSHKVDTIFPTPFKINTYTDWREHYMKKYAEWLYSYKEVKRRETDSCPVDWKIDKHVDSVTTPSSTRVNYPFIQLEFTSGGPYVVYTTDVWGENELEGYDFDHQVIWLNKMCNHMKILLNEYGIVINSDYLLEKVELPASTSLSL